MADAAMARPELGGDAGHDELEATVGWLARIGSCRDASLAPGGDRLAFVADLTGTPQVWTIPVAGGFPTLVTALDEQVNSVVWSPTGDWLAFSAAPGGGMNEQIYVVRPDGTALRRLTGGGGATNTLAGWTRDGTALRISSNRRDGAALDPYLLDPHTGAWRLLRAAAGRSALLDLSRDGRLAIESRLLSRGDNDLYLLDLQADTATLLTPHSGPGTFANARFTADARAIYLIANGDRDLLAFATITLDDAGQPGPLTFLAERADAELDELALSEDGRTVALLWNAAGRSELAFYDTASGTVTVGPALPGEVVRGLQFTGDGRDLALTVSGATAPQDIWLLDRLGGALRQITSSPHPGTDLGTLVRPELARFPAHDGLELSGWLYRPHGATAPGPLVLDFHGGPEGQARPIFNATYQALLARGIAVFAPNVRGSSGFGKRFVNLDNGALRHDAVRDILACVDYVIGAGAADPARVGIMGGSYGGYMTMAGLADYPDRFAAGANLYGVVNFATFFAHTEPWMAAISKVEYGDPDTQADLLHELSPIHRLGNVTAPTLVLHGANDTNVPVVEAEQVVEGLRGRGIPVEYILFPDEGHGFRNTANRIFATAAIVRWFEAYL
ncbi:MAG TPA: S9 family peptidase [Thermomicrobiales bacterium]